MLKIMVELFAHEDGRSPVKEFLNSCEVRKQVKILSALKYLEEFGPTSAIPNTKKLKGTALWELRILGKDNIRIFYAPKGKERIVVLHIFLKKKRKTPPKEIEIALKRYEAYT